MKDNIGVAPENKGYRLEQVEEECMKIVMADDNTIVLQSYADERFS